MPRTKSEFVSSAGTVFELVKTLSDEVNSLGGNDDHLRRILSDKALVRQVAELLVSRSTNQVFSLTIDYTRTLAEMVGAGSYNYTDPDITEKHFPVGAGDAEVEAVLIHLNDLASYEEVLVMIESQGLRPGVLPELTALGEQYPDQQREVPIIALGSVWTGTHGFRRVAYLWEDREGHGLGLDWTDAQWGANCRFLAVRKPSTKA